MKKICSMMLGAILVTSTVFATSCEKSKDVIDGPYMVTINANEGGRVSVPINEIEFGENVPISIKPNQGYRVKEFKINGEKINIVGDTYTEYCVTEDLVIDVVFASQYTSVKFDTAGRDVLRNKQFTFYFNKGGHTRDATDCTN